jgi:hypothetical protein
VETAERTIAGRYRLEERLGSGGMGIVWRAEDTVLGRPVALKEVTFPPGVPESEREVLRERTRREARAAAKLDHESAVTVYDVAEDDGTPFLVMELVDARTLAEVIASDGPLSPRRAAEVGLAVLGALEAAHAQGIVHRDVKPSNVLLREDGRVVLTDFGIATFTGDSSITSTGLLLGSPSYIAPERAKGETPGPPSDLWSLGATLFTAVEGRAPYDQGEALPTLTAVITADHEAFHAAGPLAPVLDGLLEKDPDQRFDAGRTREALEQVVLADHTTRRHARPPVPAEGGSARTQALNLGAVANEVAAVPYPEGHEVLAQRTPATGRTRQRLPVAPVLACVVLIALVVGAAVLLSDKPPGTRTGADAQPSASATAVAGRSSVPEGWTTHAYAGATVAVPASYEVGSFGGFPQYKDPTTGRTLRISATPPGGGKSDAVQDRRDQAAAFRTNHSGYREIAIRSADYRGLEAADWEFTYASGGATLHVVNRVFVVDGRGWSLFFQTRSSDDWNAARAEFDHMAAAFKP